MQSNGFGIGKGWPGLRFGLGENLSLLGLYVHILMLETFSNMFKLFISDYAYSNYCKQSLYIYIIPYTWMYIYLHIYNIHRDTYMYIYLILYLCICMYIYICICVWICIYIFKIHIYTYTLCIYITIISCTVKSPQDPEIPRHRCPRPLSFSPESNPGAAAGWFSSWNISFKCMVYSGNPTKTDEDWGYPPWLWKAPG